MIRNKIYILFLSFFLFSVFFYVPQVISHQASSEEELIHDKSNLSSEEWNTLVDFAKQYVKTHFDQISIRVIESGFVRVGIEGQSPLMKKKGIKKLRINYWPIHCDRPLTLGSIHDHTNYFESKIVDGGYLHSLFEVVDSSSPEEDSHQPVDVWRVDKSDQTVKKIRRGRVLKTADVLQLKGDVVLIPTTVKHRLEQALPMTLTVNAIFDHDDAKNYFHIYPDVGTSYEQIQIDRPEVLSEREAILRQILETLDFSTTHSKTGEFNE